MKKTTLLLTFFLFTSLISVQAIDTLEEPLVFEGSGLIEYTGKGVVYLYDLEDCTVRIKYFGQVSEEGSFEHYETLGGWTVYTGDGSLTVESSEEEDMQIVGSCGSASVVINSFDALFNMFGGGAMRVEEDTQSGNVEVYYIGGSPDSGSPAGSCGLDDPPEQIPEFSLVGAGLALFGATGAYMFLRKRNRK